MGFIWSLMQPRALVLLAPRSRNASTALPALEVLRGMDELGKGQSGQGALRAAEMRGSASSRTPFAPRSVRRRTLKRRR